MARKQTGIYRADVTLPDAKPHYYYYGRNAEVVKQDALERFADATDVKVVKVGTFKYTINEPVVPFTPEETRQIENHYLKEMIKNEALKAKLRAVAGV